MSDEMENCILEDQLSSCIRERCTYWDSDLECCVRVSLKMSKQQRRDWRTQRIKEIAELAGGKR